MRNDPRSGGIRRRGRCTPGRRPVRTRWPAAVAVTTLAAALAVASTSPAGAGPGPAPTDPPATLATPTTISTTTSTTKTTAAPTATSVSTPPSTAGAATAPDGSEAGDGRLDGAIVGGVPATLDDAPWAAALAYSWEPDGYYAQFCGGNLIAPDLVLTAAHCVTDPGLVPGDVDVILGRTRLSATNGERRHVASISVHPGYSDYFLRYDFALLRLAAPSAQTWIPLGDASLWEPGRDAQVVGWGCTLTGSIGECLSWTDDLLKGDTTIQSDSLCSGGGFDPESMLCVRDSRLAQVSCQGDSGGGLTVVGADSRWYLVGLVSHGPVGCDPADIDVYAWVPAAVPWLDDVLSGPYWRGWDIARSVAYDPGGFGPYVLDGWGGVHPTGFAPRVSGTPYWKGWDIARGIALTGYREGYVLDGWGGLHGFGGAPALEGPYWKGWDIARGVAIVAGTSKGYVLDGWGGLHAVGGADPAQGPYWKGWDIARDVALLPGGAGGYVLDGWGGLHRFGNAPVARGGLYWKGWDIARGVTIAPDGHRGVVLDGWGGKHPFTIG